MWQTLSFSKTSDKASAPSPTLFNLCIAKPEKISSHEQIRGK